MTNIFLFREKQARLLIRQKDLVHQNHLLRQKIAQDVAHLARPLTYVDSFVRGVGCIGRQIRRYPAVFVGGLVLALILKPRGIKRLMGFGLTSYRVFRRFSGTGALVFDLIARRVLR